jgi:5,10-methylenetetrahydromethanopterin reductase
MTTHHNHRLGLGLLGAPELRTMVELAQLAETQGFESVWVAETRLTRDGITPCAAIAMATTHLRIATGIINVYTRGAVLTAVSFVSLDEVSQGRIIMGLGTGSPLVLKPQGVAFHKPLTRLRETIEVVQALIRGEAVTYTGDTIQVTEAKLEMTPLRRHIPLSSWRDGSESPGAGWRERGWRHPQRVLAHQLCRARARQSRNWGEARWQTLGGGRH